MAVKVNQHHAGNNITLFENNLVADADILPQLNAKPLCKIAGLHMNFTALGITGGIEVVNEKQKFIRILYAGNAQVCHLLFIRINIAGIVICHRQIWLK